MKKIIVAAFLIIIVSNSFSQNNPRPSRSRLWNNKYSTFQVRPGDILVYEVNDSGDVYNFIATVRKYGDAITFDYNLTGKSIKGTTTISSNAVQTATSYDNNYTNTNKNLKDKMTVWLSQSNFRDLATTGKQTKMDMGGGMETFVREAISTQKIKYKGRNKIVTVYKIANQNAAERKEILTLTDINNPLIVQMDLGWKITLKEVR